MGQRKPDLDNYSIRIKSGMISGVIPDSQIMDDHPEEEIFDAHGQFVMPGNICTHTHFYGAFSRGLAIKGAPPQNFVEILQKLWWRLDRSLDPDAVYLSALVCIIDAIQHGTTTLFDHHASQNFIHGSLDLIAEAVLKSGIRADLCYEVTDRDANNVRLKA